MSYISTKVTTPGPASRNFRERRRRIASLLLSNNWRLDQKDPPMDRSWDLLQYAKRDFVRREWSPTWTERWTELNWVNFELNELNFWDFRYLIELNWTNFPKQFWERELNWTELKPKLFELWTRGSQKFTNCSGPARRFNHQRDIRRDWYSAVRIRRIAASVTCPLGCRGRKEWKDLELCDIQGRVQSYSGDQF